MAPKKKNKKPYWSREGFFLGARTMLPVAPGMIAFGLVVGGTTAAKGFTYLECLLMNVVVYAGASQMVAMELWPQTLNLASIAALAIIAGTVNARMLLLSAALRPWLGSLPSWQTYPLLHLLTDPGWIASMRYHREGGWDAGFLLGSSVIFFWLWMTAVSAGYFLGALIANPKAIGLDLVMPIFFAAMLIPLWRGPKNIVPWFTAGAVSLLVYFLVPGWWYVVAGALAGSIAGGFSDDD